MPPVSTSKIHYIYTDALSMINVFVLTSFYNVDVVYNAYSYLFSSKSPTALSLDPHPVPERSFILLLLLAVQPGEFCGKGGNEFRNAIAKLKDELGNEHGNFGKTLND